MDGRYSNIKNDKDKNIIEVQYTMQHSVYFLEQSRK